MEAISSQNAAISGTCQAGKLDPRSIGPPFALVIAAIENAIIMVIKQRLRAARKLASAA